MTRTAVWTVPTIATVVAAPAFAASPCATAYTGTVSFAGGGNYIRATNVAGAAIVTPANPLDALTVNFNSAATGYTRDLRNLNKNDLVVNELQLYQLRTASSTTSSSNQTLTISFTRPVTNLSFFIDGFTRPSDTTYIDTAYTSPAPSTFVNGADVLGDGTPGNPFRPVGISTIFVGPRTTTTVTYPGPLTSLDIVYWSSSPTSNNSVPQAIYLGPLTFNFKPVGC